MDTLTKSSLQRLQWYLCFSGFMDLLGVSLLMPLLIHQAKALGATSSQVGLFGSMYGLLQLVTNPIMGQVSDHLGRKTVLIVSLVATSFGYCMLGLANSMLLLTLARIPSGVFKHSLTMNRTLLADITPPKENASIQGTFNSLSSFGFIIGPAIGGILATTENGFFKVSVIASTIFLFNACLMYMLVPTTQFFVKDKEVEEKKKNPSSLTLLGGVFSNYRDLSMIPWRKIWNPFINRSLFALAVILFRSNFGSILAYRFKVDTKTNGFIMSFNGIVSALGSALVRWIAPFFKSNTTLHNAFSVLLVLSLVALTVAPSLAVVVIAIIPLCISSSVLRITNSVAIYESGGEKVRGLLIGLSNTLTSFSRAVGPAISGFAQDVSVYGPGSCSVVIASIATIIGFVHDSYLKMHLD